jgi:hypothetical protein
MRLFFGALPLRLKRTTTWGSAGSACTSSRRRYASSLGRMPGVHHDRDEPALALRYRGAAEQASLLAGLEKRPRFVCASGALLAAQSPSGILSEDPARDRFVQAGAKQHEHARAGFGPRCADRCAGARKGSERDGSAALRATRRPWGAVIVETGTSMNGADSMCVRQRRFSFATSRMSPPSSRSRRNAAPSARRVMPPTGATCRRPPRQAPPRARARPRAGLATSSRRPRHSFRHRMEAPPTGISARQWIAPNHCRPWPCSRVVCATTFLLN